MSKVTTARFRKVRREVWDDPEFRDMGDRDRLYYLERLVYGNNWLRRLFHAGQEFEVGIAVGLCVGILIGVAAAIVTTMTRG